MQPMRQTLGRHSQATGKVRIYVDERIDRSAAMVAAARRRNRSCIATGRAVIRQVALAEARFSASSFDRALAVNVNVFWLDPAAELATLRRILRPGGMVCLVYQPPSAGRVPSWPRAVPAFCASMGSRGCGSQLWTSARASG